MSSPPSHQDQTLLTLHELEAAVSQALSINYAPPRNGQIRALPNARALRYYTSLGLIDRPALMRGRTALYGRRHLLQVVAIKRLQESGRLRRVGSDKTGHWEIVDG